MPPYNYECDNCERKHIVFHAMNDPKPPAMCPYCWGESHRTFSARITASVFQEYRVAYKPGQFVEVKTARQDRDLGKTHDICRVTSDEVGWSKPREIKMRPFAEDYQRMSAVAVGEK